MKKGSKRLVNILGFYPTNKVLDFLIENKTECFPLTEIRDKASVRYSTLKLLIPQILERELVFIKRNVGKIKFYQINLDNPFIKSFMGSKRKKR